MSRLRTLAGFLGWLPRSALLISIGRPSIHEAAGQEMTAGLPHRNWKRAFGVFAVATNTARLIVVASRRTPAGKRVPRESSQ